MPIASPEVYAEMLDRAKAGKFAYPAINCTSSQTIVAALRGFAEAESDGIIQFSWGGAEFASGQGVKSMVAGAVALAEFAHSIAKNYPINVALHTDHCPKDKLDGYMEPLVDISQERVAAGLPLFQSHMWDGSAVPLKENLEIAEELLAKACHKANIILEIEIGVVGGEEDGVESLNDAKLFSSIEDAIATAEGPRPR
jgi:fructose-bisphosphate aldolase class II